MEVSRQKLGVATAAPLFSLSFSFAALAIIANSFFIPKQQEQTNSSMRALQRGRAELC
jgi:hypothetical protein